MIRDNNRAAEFVRNGPRCKAHSRGDKQKQPEERSVSTSLRHVAREFSVDFSLSRLLGLVG